MTSKADCPECGVSPEDINKLTDEIDRLRQERDELHALGQKASERADIAERDRDLWRERHDRERAAHAKNLEEQRKVEAERDQLRTDLVETQAIAHSRLEELKRCRSMPDGARRSACPACGWTFGTHAPSCEQCKCSSPEPALVNHGLNSICDKCGQMIV